MPLHNAQSLTPKQQLAADGLGMGKTIDEAAKYANCSERSIDVWLKKEPFKKAVEESTRRYRDEVWLKEAEAIRLSASDTGKQLDTLFKNIIDKFIEWSETLDLDSLSDTNKLKLLSEIRAAYADGFDYRDKAWAIERAIEFMEEASKS